MRTGSHSVLDFSQAQSRVRATQIPMSRLSCQSPSGTLIVAPAKIIECGFILGYYVPVLQSSRHPGCRIHPHNKKNSRHVLHNRPRSWIFLAPSAFQRQVNHGALHSSHRIVRLYSTRVLASSHQTSPDISILATSNLITSFGRILFRPPFARRRQRRSQAICLSAGASFCRSNPPAGHDVSCFLQRQAGSPNPLHQQCG